MSFSGQLYRSQTSKLSYRLFRIKINYKIFSLFCISYVFYIYFYINKQNEKQSIMKTQEIKTGTRIRTKGFDISIGKRIDQIGLISQSTDEFTPFEAIRKGGRLAKIKRKFKSKLSSSTHFFFEGFSENDTLQLIKMLN